MKVKNTIGEEIEFTPDIARFNLRQAESWFSAAESFEREGDKASAKMYLNLASELESRTIALTKEAGLDTVLIYGTETKC